MASQTLLSLALSLQTRLNETCKRGGINLTGERLDIAGVVAVARYNCIPAVNDEVLVRLAESTEAIRGHQSGLHGSTTVYGIHTGFGGSSDTRTRDSSSLETGLLQLLQSAVLTDEDLNMSSASRRLGLQPHCMHYTWTRAMMTVRTNQCVRGHSAISRNTISSLLRVLAAGIIPVVPLRGTISASGDLIPLSYVAGALEGSPDISVIWGTGPSGRLISAQDALIEIDMKPLRLGPREALGLVNGTAASAAAASLVMLDSMHLTLVAAGLTCLVAEGMAARAEWLHPFIAKTRPHPGQIEVAGIMRSFLKGSQLVSGQEKGANSQPPSLNVRPDGGLSQDRYPLRTSPQWLGPQFEDLLTSYSQISIELNSTSDNPLTDPATGNIHHGGNFQATSITSAVEKVRSSLQMVGKMLFSQCTEMLNHKMSGGLPPSLAADDPSVSFCCKGLDISLASYQSELSFLSNSINNHIQSAEMHNQALNSLAFLSTRYSMQAVELTGMMVAGVLYCACQAIDLRVMHATFLETVTPTLSKTFVRSLQSDRKSDVIGVPLTAAFQSLQNDWWENAGMDASDRTLSAASAFVRTLNPASTSFRSEFESFEFSAKEIYQLRSDLQEDMLNAYLAHRSEFMHKPTSERYIGAGSKFLYNLVRKELGVPMHRGLEDHPVPGILAGKKTIGTHVTNIFEAVRDGRLFENFALASKELKLDVETSFGVHA